MFFQVRAHAPRNASAPTWAPRRALHTVGVAATLAAFSFVGATPAIAANANEMSPEYNEVPTQLSRLTSSQTKSSIHALRGTYSKSYIGRYEVVGDHVQGMAELGDRRIAVAQNGGFGFKGFMMISKSGADVNNQSGGVAFVGLTSKNPSGMQAAGSLIAVAESEPNRIEIVDARNPEKPVLLPNATAGLGEKRLPGTLSSVGLAYDRKRSFYWLLLAGANSSTLCRSSNGSLTSGSVSWYCGGLPTNRGYPLRTAQGGTQLVFGTDGRLWVMAYESMRPGGRQVVHLSEISGLDSCDSGYCAPGQTPRSSYEIRRVPDVNHPGANFRWGGTVRAGRNIGITSSPRQLHGGPSRPFMLFHERYWD